MAGIFASKMDKIAARDCIRVFIHVSIRQSSSVTGFPQMKCVIIAAPSPTRMQPPTLETQTPEPDVETKGEAKDAIPTEARSASENAPLTMTPSSRN